MPCSSSCRSVPSSPHRAGWRSSSISSRFQRPTSYYLRIMGTPKNNQVKNETNYSGSFKSYDKTPEEMAVEAWQPDKTLLNAGTKTSFDAARRGVMEGGYSGITNPVLAQRMQQIALEELADREASAMGDADLERNQMELQKRQFLA